MWKFTALSLILLYLLFVPFTRVYAQNLSNGTAIGVSITEKNIKDGAIISANDGGYNLTNTPYDPQIFGVISLKPALYLSDATSPGDLPVISVGQVKVLVTTSNGNIKKGDFITSSSMPGIGEKATSNGFVLGSAEQNFVNKDPKKVGTIIVTLHPHFATLTNDITTNLLNTVNLGFTAATQTPLGVIRYVVSGAITLFSFYFGFRFFARASNRGVEAIGRNPLARKAILASVIINSIITIATMLFGVAIAYLILVL